MFISGAAKETDWLGVEAELGPEEPGLREPVILEHRGQGLNVGRHSALAELCCRRRECSAGSVSRLQQGSR